MNLHIKKAIISAISRVIHRGITAFIFKRARNMTSVKSRLKVPRKRPDTRLITLYQYDFILEARTEWVVYNLNNKGTKRKTRQELVDAINLHLGLDKSESYYNEIWSGKKKRESFVEVPLI
jgi:hypothetical protein